MPRGIALVVTALALSVVAYAQSSTAASCVQVKGSDQCNRAAFVKLLAQAKTISVETQPYDRNGQRELKELVNHLGKKVAAAHGNLVFRLQRLSPNNNVYFGPNDRALASLRVYSRGSLVWVERFTGEPGTPWPTVVYETIQQFQGDTK